MELPELPEPLEDLIGEYWTLAWQEGRENRTHDTPEGDAGKTLFQIRQAIRAYAEKAVKQERERVAAERQDDGTYDLFHRQLCTGEGCAECARIKPLAAAIRASSEQLSNFRDR